MKKSDILYKIKYLPKSEIVKLEEYLKDLTYHYYKKIYFYTINNERTKLQVTDKKTNITKVIDIDYFVDKSIYHLKMFFKFQNFNDDEINKPDPSSNFKI